MNKKAKAKPAEATFENKAWEMIKQQMFDMYSEKISGMDCEVHHEHPTILVSGTIQDYRIEIEACCQEMADLATAAIQ